MFMHRFQTTAQARNVLKLALVSFVLLVPLGACSAASPVPLAARAVPRPASSAVVPPPWGSAYFGAWVNPSGVGNRSSQVAQTAALESQIAAATGYTRTLALHMHYYDWNSATGYIPLSGIRSDISVQDDIARKRVPVISWRCGDSLKNIASGADDSTLDAAAAIKGLNMPAMLRFFVDRVLPWLRIVLRSAISSAVVPVQMIFVEVLTTRYHHT